MEETSKRWNQSLASIKGTFASAEFRDRHRGESQDFTRERVLTFPIVVLLLLQKTTRSIQRHTHSFFRQLLGDGKVSVTPGAWTQARSKLRHTAFIELNQSILLPEVYSSEQSQHCQRWRGHRLLGMDGSTLRLPMHPQITREFGVNTASNHHGDTSTEYTFARFSVVYDLLNDIGLDAKLVAPTTGESELITQQLEYVSSNDVLIWDRGVTGFPLMAQALAKGVHFIGRCSERSFLAAQQLHRRNRAGHSQTVKLTACWTQRPKLKELNLPLAMTVRFISLRLPNGKLEVLVTSLLDEEIYLTAEFLEVYHWRWHHETYHQMLKSRLDLENWTGQTLEAVKQDVYAAVFVSNLESLLSQEVQEELSQGDAHRKNPLQVNRSVSYHAVKEQILNLLYKDVPIDQAIEELHDWMRHNPVAVRQRKIPRPKPSLHRSYHYQRNQRKPVF